MDPLNLLLKFINWNQSLVNLHVQFLWSWTAVLHVLYCLTACDQTFVYYQVR